MKRITEQSKEYKTKFLYKLWQYENTGFQPSEIVPKPGSFADKQRELETKQKHSIQLVSIPTADGSKNFWSVRMDGVEMDINAFAEKIGVKAHTVRSWVTNKTFNQRLREKGLV